MSRPVPLRFQMVFVSSEAFILFLMASKVSSLMTCSIRQASFSAISSFTPKLNSRLLRVLCLSYVVLADARPFSVSFTRDFSPIERYPSFSSTRIALLTLGLEYPSLSAISIDRTSPLRLKIYTVSRYISPDSLSFMCLPACSLPHILLYVFYYFITRQLLCQILLLYIC